MPAAQILSMATDHSPGRLHITLFGDFLLTEAGTPLKGFNADRPQSLLAYLLLHRHAPQSRQHLAFLLWPDSTEGQARTNLRNLLHTLRRTLPWSERFIAADTMTVQWRPDAPFELDVARFEAALAAAQAAADVGSRQEYLETAVAIYQGDLLPANYDDWLGPLRDEFRRRFLDTLGRLIQLLEEKGAYRRAARYGSRLLQQDPLDESAAVQLMRLHALNGDRAAVRRIYQTMTATLQRELEVEPAAATQAAYADLLRLEIDTSRKTSLASVPDRRPRPLPVPPTPFIGRKTPLADVAARLADPHCRLLTIVGLGGMGKTRLALQTAIDHRQSFPDGVAFVSLAAVQTADLLAVTVADALQLTLAGHTSPETQLNNLLATKEMMLVLDNFEHLLAPDDHGEGRGERWLVELLQAAPAIKMLVTSRHRLELHEEWVYELQGLHIPDELTGVGLAESGAVALFVHSALRADGHFALRPENAAYIVRICQLVGGMPLGIELAASWISVLSCAEIAAEIERSLSFLTSGTRNVPERHRSIEGVIAHSWRLLSTREKEVLSRLSLFHGGFTRDAATAVAGADLALLSSLVGKSLLQRTVTGRFNLHDLVRHFGQARLADYDDADSANRHATYYLTLLAEQESVLLSAEQQQAMKTLEVEMANLREAWETAVRAGHINLLRRAGYAAWYLYELRNYFQEGKERFDRTMEVLQARLDAPSPPLEAAEKHAITVLLGELSAYSGFLRIHLGEGHEAEALTEQAVAILRPLAEPRSLSNTLSLHVLILRTNERSEEVIACSEEGLALSRDLGLLWQEGIFLAAIGAAHHDMGRYEPAYEWLKEATVVSRASGDPRLMAYIGNLFSQAAQQLGRPAEVKELLEEILRLCRQIDDRLGMGMAMEQLARAAQIEGDEDKAYRLYRESVAMYEQGGDAYHLAQALNFLGNFQLSTGTGCEAHANFMRAYEVSQSLGVTAPSLSALLGLVTLRVTGEEALPPHQQPCVIGLERALELAWGVVTLPSCSPETREQAERLCATLTAVLPAERVGAIKAGVGERPFEQLAREWLAYERSVADSALSTSSSVPTTTSRLSSRRSGTDGLTT